MRGRNSPPRHAVEELLYDIVNMSTYCHWPVPFCGGHGEILEIAVVVVVRAEAGLDHSTVGSEGIRTLSFRGDRCRALGRSKPRTLVAYIRTDVALFCVDEPLPPSIFCLFQRAGPEGLVTPSPPFVILSIRQQRLSLFLISSLFTSCLR